MVSECSVPSTNAPISRMSRSNPANVYRLEINVLLSQKLQTFEDKRFHWFKENGSEFFRSKVVKEIFMLSYPSPDLEFYFGASSI